MVKIQARFYTLKLKKYNIKCSIDITVIDVKEGENVVSMLQRNLSRLTVFVSILMAGLCVSVPAPTATPQFKLSVSQAIYGPAKESCTTQGSRLTPGDNWKSAIEKGQVGDVFLLAGSYTYTGTLSVAKGVTIKPYNCQEVVIRGSDPTGLGTAVRPQSNTTIAGIHIESSTHASLMRFENVSNVVIRNNILWGGKNDAIGITDGVSRVVFEGNDINSGPAQQCTTTTPSCGGHVFYIGNSSEPVPNTITIARNKVRGSFFGDVVSGDDTIAISSGDNILIEENWFTENYNIEQVIDIKSRNSTKPVIIRNNLFTNNFLGTKGGQDSGPGSGGPCLTIGDHDTPPNLLRHVVEENWFEDCAAADNPSGHFFISVGSSTRPGSALVRNNVYIGESITAPGAIFNQAYNTMVINNTIYRGGFKIGRSGGCIPANHLTFKNNIFYETHVTDQTDSCPGNKYAVFYNDLYNLPFGFERGNQANNITTNPQFVDSTNGNFALKSTSPAIGAGENGVDMGSSLPGGKKPLLPTNLRVSVSP